MVKPPASFPHMYSDWITVGPEALYWTPKIVAKLWRREGDCTSRRMVARRRMC